ncbi:sulfite exporter TauE/SafE family protein [Candidatus Saccharibacteria bacterium]|nr:sulfite exporter TauE/SafE family protein [Candidatus Saccharibacteria bacterium]
MDLIFVSFVAGVLTVAAPCILPLLPVIIGGSLTDDDKKHRYLGPITIALSLAASVVLFGLILKASTALLGVPQVVWQLISGGIVLLFGITMLFPKAWELFMAKTRLNLAANELMGKSYKKSGFIRNILLGASLGPVFSSCSPTYALIIAVILPASFASGFFNLLAYGVGLASILLLISILGKSLTDKMNWLSNPNGWFRKTIGVLFVVVALAIILGFDKDIQSYVLDKGWYNPISNLEENISN